MHVCCWELECVVEALGLDGAVVAYLAGLCDVGDVFVVVGEHLVGFVFAVGLCPPVVLVCCVCIGVVVGFGVFC